MLEFFALNLMTAFNQGTIIGTIVSPITLKHPTDALTVAELRMAPLAQQEGESPIPVVAYNGVAQRIAERYNQGDTIGLTYRLRYRTWRDQEDQPRSRMEIVATTTNTIRLGKLSTAKRAEEAAGIQPQPEVAPQFSAEPTLEAVPF
jgi:single-stranded DNA-binding protein